MKGQVIFASIFLIFLLGIVFSTAPNISDFNPSSAVVKVNDVNFTVSAIGDLNSVCFTKSSGCTQISDYTNAYATNYTLSETGLTLSEGVNNITIFIRDHNNDVLTNSSKSTSVTLDSTGPVITVAFPLETDYNRSLASENASINVSDTDSSVSSTTVKLDGATFNSPYTFSALTEGDHNIVIDSNDTLGNTSTKTVLFRIDTNAPTSAGLNNSYKTSYTNDETPDITITGTDNGMSGGKARLSCNSSLTSYYDVNLTGSSTTISDFNITSSSYDCNTADGNKIIYAKIRDKAGNWSSSTVSTNILYDNTPPGPPINLSASADNEKVSLDWDAPSSSDNLSGTNKYTVYKSTNGGSYSSYTTTSNTNSDVNNLNNNTQYCFKVSAIDKAGNESIQSEEKCATPQSTNTDLSVKKNGSNVNYAKNGDTIDVSCSFSESVTNAKIYVKYNESSSSTETIKSTSSSVSSISASFDVDTDRPSIQVWCDASGTSSSTKTISIDNTKPTLDWQDTNNTLIGIVRIYVKVTEISLSSIDLVLNNVTFGTTRVTDSNYYADINTTQIENGSYVLKATATDIAGNSTEITRNVTVSNILSAKQAAQKAIDDAKAKKLVVDDSLKYLKSQGLEVNSTVSNKKIEADNLLNKAISDVNSDFNSSKLNAENAKKKYEEILSSIATTIINTQNYDKENSNISQTLTNLGISPLDANESNNFSQNNERKLSIIKVGTSEEYQATIELTIKNDTNEGTIKVIEIIPKSFVKSASELFSDYNFVILKDDPIIEFTIDLAPGATKTITYGSGVLTKEQADTIKDNNVLASFESQPITVREDIDTKKIIQQSGLMELVTTIGIILVVIIILVIVGFIALQFINKGHGFGTESKTPTEIKQDESWPKK